MRSLGLLVVGSVLVSLSVVSGCEKKEIAGGSSDGGRIYKEVCESCHGPAGKLTDGMAKTGVKPVISEAVQALSEADLRGRIEEGSENRRMPPYKGALTDSQIAGVMSYVRSLQ